jgi:hypothetical protein
MQNKSVKAGHRPSQDLILHFLLEVMDQKPRHKKRIEAGAVGF